MKSVFVFFWLNWYIVGHIIKCTNLKCSIWCVFTILCTGAVTTQNKCWNIFIISENSLMSLSSQFQLPFPRQWFSDFYYHRLVLWIIRLHIMDSYKMYFSVLGHFILTKYFWECCVHWWFILLHCWAVFHCMKPSQSSIPWS